MLVQNLLDVTRISTGRKTLDFEEGVELGEVVDLPLSALEPRAVRIGIGDEDDRRRR